MPQTHAPDSLEDAGPHPSLETPMTRAAGTVLGRDHLPLAPGSQDVKDTVEDGPVRHPRPTVGPRRLVGRQDGFDQVPQVIGNLAASTPPFRLSAHRIVLHDVTMFLSALTARKREGFWDALLVTYPAFTVVAKRGKMRQIEASRRSLYDPDNPEAGDLSDAVWDALLS